ncbi:MAG: hypothetical protein DRO88_10550 [Promethearchaeia archaeon]|nr:MAG: hypothetical protein DRO88_10550 [Candidatus Lokiarchaeia archaeon]
MGERIVFIHLLIFIKFPRFFSIMPKLFEIKDKFINLLAKEINFPLHNLTSNKYDKGKKEKKCGYYT